MRNKRVVLVTVANQEIGPLVVKELVAHAGRVIQFPLRRGCGRGDCDGIIIRDFRGNILQEIN